MEIKEELWGPLADRYRHEQPRKILSLDGGGIRGLMTARVLVDLEAKLQAKLGRDDTFCLAEYFDYIGGTSTGAIIAAALARGMRGKPLLPFYQDFGEEAFTKASLLGRLRALYRKKPLENKLREVYGPATNLSPRDLKTLLLVVMRNRNTDSAWPISSNPQALYNIRSISGYCNLEIPLYQLVRASTAAPAYFSPEDVEVGPGETYTFVDGGTTAYNNPAFLLHRMATEPAYRLGWAKGEDKLLIVSLGTGGSAVLGGSKPNIAQAAFNTLLAVMNQAQVDQDMNCRTVGRCTYGAELDQEVGDLIPRDAQGNTIPLSTPLGRDFLYARYDVDLDPDGKGLSALDPSLADIDPEKVSKLDSTESMPDLLRIGEKLGGKVDLAHFGGFV